MDKKYATIDDVTTIVAQIVQESAQQQAKQIAQAVDQAVQSAKQGVQGTTQEKASFIENKAEEILGGESLRSATVTDTRAWNYNMKDLVAKERDYDLALKAFQLKEKSLEVAEREAKLRKQATLDSIELSERQQASLVTTMLNVEYAKFNAASSDPISPNEKG